MKKRFAIEHLGTPECDARLREVLLPYEGNPFPIARLLQQLGQAPAWCQTAFERLTQDDVDLLKLLPAPPFRCRSVIFEYDYVDKDYQDEFCSYYAKAFKRYRPVCTRLHFWDHLIPKQLRLKFERFEKHYLGFVVLRPTDLQRVGRTILRPMVTDHNHQFIHCVADFTAHILGQELTIPSMPFTQQDTQVGACAQASLWMVTRYFSARFGLRDFLPSQINQLAKTGLSFGRPLPAERGLTSFQMLDAFQGMGISALGYGFRDIDGSVSHIDPAYPVDNLKPDESNIDVVRYQLQRNLTAKLADIAYRYIESGLPVIFETNNHAFVGIGHTYDPSVSAVAAIQRIPGFIVHNDNTGPYVEIPIFPGGGTEPMTFQKVESIIAVVPTEVTLRGEDAESRARCAFADLLAAPIEDGSSDTYRTILFQLRPDLEPYFSQLEYRTYLQLSTEFQASILEAVRRKKFDRKLGLKLLELDYPKYVWVTEVSSSALLNRKAKVDRQCLGRVIVDSTAPAGTRGEIVVHCGDMAFFFDRNLAAETDVSSGRAIKPRGKGPEWIFENSTPFAHKVSVL